MRALLMAVAVAILIAVAGAFLLQKVQEPASIAFSTDAVRL
jgi:hypothetical protein